VALEQYAIVDSGREPGFDDIAELAADILDAPIAVVNFIAADRQWFKAEKGIGQDSLPLDVSICRYAILQPGVFVVPDLTQDARFVNNPLVKAAEGLRFYAGALLETPDGLPLGTVCVLDTKARPDGINERQKRALKALAGQTMAQLELRRSTASARLDHERLAAMFAQATVGMSEMSLDGRFLTVNDRLCELLGRSREELLTLSFGDITHNDDLADNLPRFARLATTGESFIVDKRYVRPDGAIVWASSSVTRLLDGLGRPRGALAVTADITARKAEERRRALLLELSDQMRRLVDAEEVVATATQRLGEELGATRVLYAEIDDRHGRATVRGSWTDGTVEHLPSDISLGEFGAPLIERLRSGGTLRVDDSLADPYTAGSLAALEAICARAIVSVPLFRGERFVVNLNVHQRAPRAWTNAEVELIEAVAERTWEAVERARTEAALRASNDRFRAAIDAIEGVLWTNDAAGRMAGEQPGWAALTGQSLQEYEGYGWTAAVHPDDAQPTLKAWNAAVASRTTFMFEHRVKRRDGAWRLFSVRAIPTFGADGAISEWVGVHTDVTEQRAAEAALRASEARLKAVIEAAPVGLVFADATGRITGGNTHVERILGHPVLPSQNVAEYRDWVSFHPDGRQVEGHEYPLARALAGEERPELEALYQRGDGRKAWVRFIAAAKRDAEGHITGGVVASLDIDAQRRAQEDLQRLNETLEQRVEETAAERERAWRVSQELLAVVEEDGTFAEINAAWTALLGWTPEELLGQPFGSFTHPDDLEETQAKFASVFEAPLTVPYEYRFRAKDGSYLWFSWTATFEHGRVYASGRNVSPERQQQAELEAAESARREADALYRAYFENTPEALFVVGIDDNGDFRVEEINPAHEAGVGLKIEDIRDRRIQDILPADVADQVLRTYRHVVETGALYQYRELFDLSGDPQHWDTSLVPVRDADGRITRLIGASRNVTRQVVAEEALRQSQKMEAMGQLTGGVAHDFNNLLTPIVGGLDMLQRKGLGGEREQRIIAGAMQSAERAKTLVQRLLAFARRQPLQAVAVDVAKLVEGMGELVSSTTGPQIKVMVEAQDDLPPAKADPNQLEMALLNLAVNARDAMSEGGTLRISAGQERIGSDHRSKLLPGRYIRLSVADNGAGMDEATLARAVEPFFSTKGVGKGTGLGLSMVHGLASQLGGALTIRSRPGLGTNVELWLPLSAGEVETLEDMPVKSAGRAGRGTVLLVDDEELVRMSTADMLSDLGYSVVEAASGEEAARLVSRGTHFDVLVTDHLMPGMTGTDLADTVRAAKPGVPVLLVSGYAEHEGIEPAIPRLTKPFRADELAARLSELITT
jgi:PAS domain S-box-containing protein